MAHELDVVGSAGVLVPVRLRLVAPPHPCLPKWPGAYFRWWAGKGGARVRSLTHGDQRIAEVQVLEVMSRRQVGGRR